MHIETDEEFLALMRARFASKPYSGLLKDSGYSGPEYWTDARYEELIAQLLKTQRVIRKAAENPPERTDAMTREAWDASVAAWAIWSIQHHDVGASPTHWHRVWQALCAVIAWVRSDEERRIAEALRQDQAAASGPTASRLIEQAIARDLPCDD